MNETNWEATTFDGGHRISDLRTMFNLVADKSHWKNAVHATVTVQKTELETLAHAVVHFTGSVPRLVVVGFPGNGDVTVRVEAAGYFAVCGA